MQYAVQANKIRKYLWPKVEKRGERSTERERERETEREREIGYLVRKWRHSFNRYIFKLPKIFHVKEKHI